MNWSKFFLFGKNLKKKTHHEICVILRVPAWLSGKRLTCNQGVLGLSHTGSSGFFHGSVLGQDTSEPQPSTGETQARHE